MLLVPQEYRLKNTIKYPTTVIVGGATSIGLELAKSLIEQGGYVVIIDTVSELALKKLEMFEKDTMISFLDFSTIPHLDEDIRRVDYVVYMGHESIDFRSPVSTQEFLTFSNYLDAILSLATKFEAKFLLTSSIKANQMLLTDTEIGLALSSSSHATYTDMELQKYAEGLVIEYEKKVNLDARVIRFGEIIGDGMDFSIPSPFVKLILSAAQGDTLELTRDGLENEWFIHLQDAAYSIVKALFSKGTKGKIFSASYDSTFTHLSIAYKIQELNDDPKEIRFIEDKDNLPAIKLYKPAPNLSDIGWMPRVSFNKAVKQSLASAKIFVAEHTLRDIKRIQKSRTAGNEPKKESFSDKLKSFLSIAKEDEENDQKDIFTTNADLVASMVTKSREEAAQKKKRILVASSELRRKRKQRSKGPFEKLEDYFWGTFIFLANTFSFLKKKSPLEVGMFLFGITFFFIAYFFIIAPTFYLVRNVFVIRVEEDRLQEAIDSKDYEAMNVSSEKITTSLKNVQSTLNKYEWVSKQVTLDDELLTLTNLVNTYIAIGEGVNDISRGLLPVNLYLKAYENNVEFRNGTESYLSISNAGQSYSQELLQIDESSALIEAGIDKVEAAKNILNESSYSNLPFVLSEEILSKNQDIVSQLEKIQFGTNESLLTEAVGKDSSQTHLILILDNTRLKPIGGDIAAFALITFQEGAITDITVQSADAVPVPGNLIDTTILDDINNTQYTYSSAGDLTLSEIGNINSHDRFAETIKLIFEANYQKEVDTVMTIDLSGLARLINTLQNNGRAMELNNVKIDSAILTSLNDLQGGNTGAEQRKKTIAQVTAKILEEILKDPSELYADVLTEFGNSYEKNEVFLSAFSGDIQNFITEKDLDATEIEGTNTYVKVGVDNKDIRVTNDTRFFDVNIIQTSNINLSGDVSNRLDVELLTGGGIQEVSICFPLATNMSSIKILEDSIPLNRFVINSSDYERCAVASLIDETDFSIEWVDTAVVNLSNVTSFEFGIGKIKGSSMSLNLDLTLPQGNIIKSINPEGINFSANKISNFKDEVFRDEIYKIILN